MQISTRLRTALGCLTILLFTVNTSLIAQTTTITFGDQGFANNDPIDDHIYTALGMQFSLYAANFDGTLATTGHLYYGEGFDTDTSTPGLETPPLFGDGGFIFTYPLSNDDWDKEPKALVIKTVSGEEFRLNSFKVHHYRSDSYGNYLRISAYIDGVLQGYENVVIASDVEPWYSTVTLTNPLFKNVDEVRITQDTEHNPDFPDWPGYDGTNHAFDTFVIGSPVVANTPPTVTGLPASIEIIEDMEGNLDIASSTFADADNDEITVSLSVSEGRIALAAPGGRPVELGGNNTPTITVTGMPDGVNGYLDFSTNVIYIPPANLNGNAAAILTVSVDDGSGDVELGTVPINIKAVNDPPTATDDNVTTDEGTEVAGNALTNDSDVDGDALTASLVTGPVHGGVTFNANGSFTYTPSAGYSGPDSLRYKVCDGQSPSLCDTAWVHMAIEAVNKVPTDISLSSTTVNQSGGVNAIVGTLSTNDPDVGDTHTYSLVSGTGSADNNSFNISGSALRTNNAPAMAADTYNVRVQTTDNNGGKYQKPFTITVADDIAPTVNIGTSKTSLKAGETAALTFTLNEASANFEVGDVTTAGGTLSDFSGGGTSYSATFTPSDNATVTATVDVNADAFTDAAGNGNIAATQQTISIDTAPPSDYTVSIDQATITLANHTSLSFTFNEAELGAAFGYEITGNNGGTPVTGSGTITAAGQQVSNIDVSGLANGTLTLSVTLTDASGNMGNPATDNVTKAVNYPPEITTSGGTTTFTEPADGEPISVTVDDELTVSDPENTTLASATVAITGNFQSDQDVLAFENDGSTMGNIGGNYSVGTLTLTSPGASATLAEWQIALRAVAYRNSSQNPSTYTRTVTFIVNDGVADSAPATKDINVVAVNTAPVAVDDAVAVNEDIPATGNVLTNDSDAEGNILTASWIGGPFNGTVVLNLDGSFTYTPNGNYIGLDSLKYQVCDNGTPSRCDTAWVRFNIQPVNDAPKITSNGGGYTASVDVLENTSTVTTVTAIDDDGDTPVFSISGGADAAEFSIDAGTGELTFNEAKDFENATDADGDNIYEVEVKASDGSDGDTQMISVSVRNVNEAPVNTVPVSQTIDQDEALVFSTGDGNAVSVSDADAWGGTVRVTLAATNGLLTLPGTTGLTFVVGSGTDDGTMTFDGTIMDINTALNGLTFMPTSGYNGVAGLQVTTDDLGLTGSGGPKKDTDSISIMVNSVNPVVIAVGSENANGTYKTDDKIKVMVTFDQAVTVDESGGSPTLLLETGDTDREAIYEAGSGSETLIFSYTVQSGDVSADLDYQSTAALTLNGATLQNVPGDNAILTLPAVGGAASIAGQHDIVIDGVAPQVSSVEVPANGYYREGNVLTFKVYIDDKVVVDVANGTPYLELTVGSTIVRAVYTGGSGSDILTFSYTVHAGDLDMDGVSLGAAIVMNGGNIRDGAGNDIIAALHNMGSTTDVLVNTIHPEVTLSTDAGSTVNAPFTVAITFSEAVTDFVLGDITAANATLSDLRTSDSITYTCLVTPLSRGLMELSVAADVVVNIAGNGNLVSNVLSVQFNEMVGDITLADSSFVYDGAAKSLAISGNLPKDASVSYENNSRTDVGTQEVTATISGDNYETLMLTADLTITEATIKGIALSDSSFVYDGIAKSLKITGTLPSGTSVDYENNSRTDVGTQEVTATISGDNYEDLVLTADLVIRSNQRSIDFPAIADRVYGDVPFSLKATSSSDEAVSYTSSDPMIAEVSATGEVTIIGAGTTTITATVPENANYANRPSVERTFTVAKAAQTISFGEVGEVSRDAGSIPLDVESSSGLAVSLEVDDEQVAMAEGTTLDILRLGTARVTATQAGNENYLPAEPVTITVRVIDENDALSLRVHKALSPNGDGINEFLMVEGVKEYPENRLIILNRNGNKVAEIEGYNNVDRVFRGVGQGNELLSSGTYYYLLEVKIDGKWKYRKGYFVIRY